MNAKSVLLLSILTVTASASAQSSFSSQWEKRASATQSKQPAWPPPLVTTYVGLIQVERIDFIRQTSTSGVQTWNFDGGKGLNLIPMARTEVDINLPGYFQHNSPKAVDGAGDMSFLLKYRFLSGNASHGAYDVSAFILGSIPTGSYKNGSTDAAVTPSVGFGKGYKAVDVQTTLGAGLPVMDTAKLGRTVASNTAVQLHLKKYFWPEAEINSTWFKGGANDGKNMTFATPGMLFTKKLKEEEPKSRLLICIGAGEQIAATHFHTYNHEIAVTSRLVF